MNAMRILVIDDSRVVRKMMVHSLSDELPGVQVDEYDPIAHGFPVTDFDWPAYDIVFLDYDLGLDGEDGLTWLQRFQNTAGLPPIVMLTDEDRTRVIVRAVKLGARDYLLKKELRTVKLAALIKEAMGLKPEEPETEEPLPTPRRPADVPDDQQEPITDPEFGYHTASQDEFDDLVVVRRHGAQVVQEALHVPGYRIVSQIAKGGMTTIFLAERMEDDLRVVLKLLFNDNSVEVPVLKYFMQEYALISRIKHPFVIKIFERAFAKDFAYIAMEYLPAGELAVRIRKGLTPDKAVTYLQQLAQGLAAVHEKGIVHRDLKPANILFRHNDTVAISDFGVAHIAQAISGIDEDDVLIGTPPYMSPEQCDGRTVDQRSDLYSLGVIFFEMLTGRKPYTAKSVTMMVDAHLHAPIPRLPEAVSRYQPLVDGLLAKDVGERFQTANELLAGLEWIK
jgi:CheY-like chemotaxis protein